ncbi:CPCC family cysteine-rich protein [Streptomyces lichenis]|nr:CPCC family cysteine-rich protein [Streptomyces lichenis]
MSEATDFERGARQAAVRYPCVCCGSRVFEDPPGSSMICPVCKWEDDITQLRWPTLRKGANRASLLEAQQSFLASGASEPRFAGSARQRTGGEEPPSGWRPIDLARDAFEKESTQMAPWPPDRTVMYWWTKRFWLREG